MGARVIAAGTEARLKKLLDLLGPKYDILGSATIVVILSKTYPIPLHLL
jgi:hypothetical protein